MAESQVSAMGRKRTFRVGDFQGSPASSAPSVSLGGGPGQDYRNAHADGDGKRHPQPPSPVLRKKEPVDDERYQDCEQRSIPPEEVADHSDFSTGLCFTSFLSRSTIAAGCPILEMSAMGRKRPVASSNGATAHGPRRSGKCACPAGSPTQFHRAHGTGSIQSELEPLDGSRPHLAPAGSCFAGPCRHSREYRLTSGRSASIRARPGLKQAAEGKE